MSAANLEIFLARLYTDARLRRAFLADPGAVARAHGLDDAEVTALRQIDRDGLELASGSFAHKRAAHADAGRRRPWIARMREWLRLGAFSPPL
jgi:hypothetical protein